METRSCLNDTVWAVRQVKKQAFLLQNFYRLDQSATLPDSLEALTAVYLDTLRSALQCAGNMNTISPATSPGKANPWGVLSRKLCRLQKSFTVAFYPSQASWCIPAPLAFF